MNLPKEITPLLFNEITRLKMKLIKLEKILKELQSLCTHEWTDDGESLYKKHYICIICEKTKSRREDDY